MRYVAECRIKRFWQGRLWAIGEVYAGDVLPPPQFLIVSDAGDPVVNDPKPAASPEVEPVIKERDPEPEREPERRPGRKKIYR